MPNTFSSIQSLADSRIWEVRSVLNHIRGLQELETSDAASADLSKAVRGLFFVYLYGALEYSLQLCVQVYLQSIGSVDAQYIHLEHGFHTLALDSRFESVKATQGKNHWKARRELLVQQNSNEKCSVPDTVMANQLQNVDSESLEVVFASFCIDTSPFPDARHRRLLNDVKENRNAVAHGRRSPIEVGGNYTILEIEDYLAVVTRVVERFVSTLGKHFEERRFIKSVNRSGYLP